ncbi:MAG: hypothetical protein LBK18_02625 [Prevotellaceae bacterium]|nr:hypothetical protein [Prevotellaceae bacterium]
MKYSLAAGYKPAQIIATFVAGTQITAANPSAAGITLFEMPCTGKLKPKP